MILVICCASRWIVRRSSAVLPVTSLHSASSAAAAITVTGVRNSWEASDVKRRSRSKDTSSASSMALKVSANSPTSSAVVIPVMRPDMSSPVIDCAVCVMV